MPTADEARELAAECDRLVTTATNAENRALLVKIAQLWRAVAAREEAVAGGQAIAMPERRSSGGETAAGSILANSQAEALLLKTRARHWRTRANEIRGLARGARTELVQETFVRLADNYETLADQADVTAGAITEAQAV
jgi:hypothetical protein